MNTTMTTKRVCSSAWYILLMAFAGFVLLTFTTAVTATGWVKLYDAKSTTDKHNLYEVKGVMKGFPYGKVYATNVRTGPNATDPQIPDGYYYVTFWIENPPGTEVEHKEKMEFKGGSTVNGLPITVSGKITSCGVSYPP